MRCPTLHHYHDCHSTTSFHTITYRGGGGILYRDYFAAENFVGGKFRHPWESRSSNCLVPASWSQAFFSAQKAVNPLTGSTTSKGTSKRRTGRLAPGHAPQHPLTPLNFARGKFRHLPLKTKFYHEIIPPTKFPPPCTIILHSGARARHVHLLYAVQQVCQPSVKMLGAPHISFVCMAVWLFGMVVWNDGVEQKLQQ